MDRTTFNVNSPKTFILAANNWSETESFEDQVWSLALNPSGPHPFHLSTTYGLKARLVQVFPDILSENQNRLTNKNYRQTPTVTHYSPSFLRIAYQLKTGLEVRFSALTPEPSVLCGTILIKNQGATRLDLRHELIFHLLPLGKGQHSHIEKVGTHNLITAQTADLCPVLFMTGGPTAGNSPFPALSLPLQLSPDESHTVTWALVSRHSQDGSFKTAQRIITQPWQKVQQEQIMKQSQRTLHIQTGEPDWDAAFQLAQTIPHTHFIKPKPAGSNPIFVRTRLPDHPAPSKTLLADQDDLTALELNHLAHVLLPQCPELMASLVMKHLSRIDQNGKIYSKRNTSSFVKPSQELPMLAGLCLEIYEVNHDQTFLQAAFSQLCQSTQAWLFSDPEETQPRPFTWQNSDQPQLFSGFYPFDTWEETGGGLDIRFTESPAVLAILLREVHSFKIIAEILQDLISLKRFGKLERELQKKLDAFWDEQLGTYVYRDVVSKHTPEGDRLLNASYKDEFSLERKFNPSQRLVCHIQASDERTRVCQVTFTGRDESGNEVVEVFKPAQIRWIAGRSYLTTKNLFKELKTLRIKGLGTEDKIKLKAAGFTHQDITGLAPIWAGGLPGEHLITLLKSLIDHEHPNFHRGLPEILPVGPVPPDDLEIAVNVLWNALILRGMARQGHTELAAELFTNLMNAVLDGLRDYGGFYPYYRATDGRPLGKPNAVQGLLPLRLFLEIAGIRILSPNRVALWGRNPFPWPTEVHWQGLSLHKDGEATTITFPDGATQTYTGTKPILATPEWREP